MAKETQQKPPTPPVQKEPELKLNGAQIKQLETMIQEMPTKYGLPMLNFLNGIAQENSKALQAEGQQS